MSFAALAIAVLFAKYGGGLIRNQHPGEILPGWAFLLAGIAVAFAAGSRW